MFSKDNIIAFAAGAATVSFCSWAYMKYRHAYISQRIADEATQTVEVQLKHKGNQTEMLKKVSMAVMAKPITQSCSTITTKSKVTEIGVQTSNIPCLDASTSTRDPGLEESPISSASSSDDVYFLCQEELIVEASQRYVDDSETQSAIAENCAEPNKKVQVMIRSQVAVKDAIVKESNLNVAKASHP